MTGLAVPKISEIELTSQESFHFIDTDYNGKIDVEEFVKWLENNYSLSNFILKFTGC